MAVRQRSQAIDEREDVEKQFIALRGNDAWKQDKNCSYWGVKFGGKLSTGQKKFVCKFCFRGVCAKCSQHEKAAPGEAKALRYCMGCFSSDLRKVVKKNFERRIVKNNSSIQELETELQQAKKDHRRESINRSQLEKEFDTLVNSSQAGSHQDTLDELNMKYAELKQNTDVLRRHWDLLDKNKIDLDNHLSSIQDKHIIFKKERNSSNRTVGQLKKSLIDLQEESTTLRRQSEVCILDTMDLTNDDAPEELIARESCRCEIF